MHRKNLFILKNNVLICLPQLLKLGNNYFYVYYYLLYLLFIFLQKILERFS